MGELYLLIKMEQYHDLTQYYQLKNLISLQSEEAKDSLLYIDMVFPRSVIFDSFLQYIHFVIEGKCHVSGGSYGIQVNPHALEGGTSYKEEGQRLRLKCERPCMMSKLVKCIIYVYINFDDIMSHQSLISCFSNGFKSPSNTAKR